MRRLIHHREGFTLVETLFGLALFVLFSGFVWSLQRDFNKENILIQSSMVGQHEISRTFKILSAEARAATPSSLGAYPIAEATSTSFTFYSDGDKDGLQERLRYFIDNGSLKRGYLKPTGTPLTYNPANEVVGIVVRDVANGITPAFAYYDTSYDGTTPALTQPINVLNIRLIKVTVVVDKNGLRAPTPVTFTTQISIRNLKDNT